MGGRDVSVARTTLNVRRLGGRVPESSGKSKSVNWRFIMPEVSRISSPTAIEFAGNTRDVGLGCVAA